MVKGEKKKIFPGRKKKVRKKNVIFLTRNQWEKLKTELQKEVARNRLKRILEILKQVKDINIKQEAEELAMKAQIEISERQLKDESDEDIARRKSLEEELIERRQESLEETVEAETKEKDISVPPPMYGTSSPEGYTAYAQYSSYKGRLTAEDITTKKRTKNKNKRSLQEFREKLISSDRLNKDRKKYILDNI